MIFGIDTTCDISKLSQISIMYNNFEISLVVFMPNIATNHAITYTDRYFLEIFYATYTMGAFLASFEISHKSKKRHFEMKKKSPSYILQAAEHKKT